MIAITHKQKHEKQFIEMAHKVEVSRDGLSARAKRENFSNIFSAADFGGGLNRMVSCTTILTNLSVTLRGRKDSYIKFTDPPQAEMFKAMNAIVSEIELHSLNGHVDTVARSAAALLRFVMRNFFYNPDGNDKGMTFEEVHQFLDLLQSFAEEEKQLEKLDEHLANQQNLLNQQSTLESVRKQIIEKANNFGMTPALNKDYQQVETDLSKVNGQLSRLETTISNVQSALAKLRTYTNQTQMLNDCMGALSVRAVMDMKSYNDALANYQEAVIEIDAINKELEDGSIKIKALNDQFVNNPQSNQETQGKPGYNKAFMEAVAESQSHADNAAKFHADGYPGTNPQFNPNVNPQFNPNANPQFNPNVNPQFNPNVNPQFNPNANPQFNPNVNPQFNPNVNPQFNPNVNPQFNPNVNPQFNPNVNPQFDPNANPQFNPNVNPQYLNKG